MSTRIPLSLTFYGGVGSVTGSNFLLTDGATRLLVDCGLFQGGKSAEAKNAEDFPYAPSSINTLLVTHAHLDHVGRIPKLVKDGFNGTIWSTPATKDLARLIMNNAAGLMESGERMEDMPALYVRGDVERALSLWKTIPYHEEVSVGGEFEVSFKDAGHILGSAIIEVRHRGGVSVAFSGDLGNSPSPLLKDTETVSDVDYMLVESVYGDRNHESVEERTEMLEDVIESTVARNGTLLIPAFSIERTQVLLFEINNLVEGGKIPNIPIFLDSPLAIDVTDVYQEYSEKFNAETQKQITAGDNIFEFKGLKMTASSAESRAIEKHDGAKVIIAGSGMSVGGRILNHEKRYLPDPKNSILFVGYQSAGSVGRQILDGAREVMIDDVVVPVRARIASVLGYSAHKDMDGLMGFVEAAAPRLKEVFVVMGEPKSSLFLTQRIRDYIGVEARAPEAGQTVVLK